MRLYTVRDLAKIGLGDYACENLRIVSGNYWSKHKDYYCVPTQELELLVKEHNFVAVLRGLKPVKPRYRDCYFSEQHNCWRFNQ